MTPLTAIRGALCRFALQGVARFRGFSTRQPIEGSGPRNRTETRDRANFPAGGDHPHPHVAEENDYAIIRVSFFSTDEVGPTPLRAC